MDFEMRFLSIFYAVISAVTAIALVAVLLLELAPLMLIIVPMFLAMGALLVAVRDPDAT